MPGFINYKKGCTRLTAASDKVYQLFAHGRWFSLGSPPSSTTKTGRHYIAEILLKVALNTINQIKIIAYHSSTKFGRITFPLRVRRGHGRIVVGFTTTYAIGAYRYQVQIPLRRGVLDTTLCDKLCQ